MSSKKLLKPRILSVKDERVPEDLTEHLLKFGATSSSLSSVRSLEALIDWNAVEVEKLEPTVWNSYRSVQRQRNVDVPTFAEIKAQAATSEGITSSLTSNGVALRQLNPIIEPEMVDNNDDRGPIDGEVDPEEMGHEEHEDDAAALSGSDSDHESKEEVEDSEEDSPLLVTATSSAATSQVTRVIEALLKSRLAVEAAEADLDIYPDMFETAHAKRTKEYELADASAKRASLVKECKGPQSFLTALRIWAMVYSDKDTPPKWYPFAASMQIRDEFQALFESKESENKTGLLATTCWAATELSTKLNDGVDDPQQTDQSEANNKLQ